MISATGPVSASPSGRAMNEPAMSNEWTRASFSGATFCWIARSHATLKISKPKPCANAPASTT